MADINNQFYTIDTILTLYRPTLCFITLMRERTLLFAVVEQNGTFHSNRTNSFQTRTAAAAAASGTVVTRPSQSEDVSPNSIIYFTLINLYHKYTETPQPDII